MRSTYLKKIPSLLIAAAAAFALAAAPACTNAPNAKKASKSSTSNLNNGSSSNTGSYNTFTISSVSITLPEAGSTSTAPLPVTVYMDTGKSSGSMADNCQAASALFGSSRPCVCQFAWSEVNASSASPVTIPRLVQTEVTAVQSAAVGCTTPEGFLTEIPTDTTIRVSVLPAPGNSSNFTTSNYSYSKATGTESGNFKDSQGRSFANILRYACYDQRQRGMTIKNRMGSVSDTGSLGGGSRTYPIANKFCLRKADGRVLGDPAGCQNVDPVDYTAQSYYYNLFIRENESGDINPGNGRFVCPTVKESLANNGTIGSQGKYWPLDATFALSLGRTTDFAVGVVANSKTSSPGDPVTTMTGCDGETTGTANKDSLVSSCLGFAAKPKNDGSCPAFVDSGGTTVKTYRLRRYIALYPPAYDTNGAAIEEPQSVDTIYVLDRPVATGNAALNYTMLGPKPCPFAYFDNKKVTSITRNYRATNSSGWNGKNVDGIKFPDMDCKARTSSGECAAATAPSCAATLPLINSSMTMLTATTIHSSNPVGAGLFPGDPARSLKSVYVRPVSAWAPHYEEDVSFQACAPLASPFRDAPLHLAKLSADPDKVTYCAEAYPTQNDNVGKIDERVTPDDLTTAYTGNVIPFTSHVPKNAVTSCATGSATIPTIPSNYPAAGRAHHPGTQTWDNGTMADTCDRTVVNPTNGLDWPRFPLLAQPVAVEAALQSDESYACLITRDDGTKLGIASPTQGCCGLATTVGAGATNSTQPDSTAHLEPPAAPGTSACQVPSY